MAVAGLIYGPEFHHLDHLAPLCALLEIPLILTEQKLAIEAEKFYPDVKIFLWDPNETPEKLVSSFDTIIYSTPRVLFDEVFFFAQHLQRRKIRTIWCPHGNSDKGRNSLFMEALKEEELLLTYGPRIEAFLKEKGVAAPTKRVGNYRLFYYEKHKKFFDSLLSTSEKPSLLYAPTWQDQENNSSFPKIWPLLLEAPKAFSLMVKLHPNLYQQFPEEIGLLRKGGVQLIEDFSPIYPLLAKTDLFIGDMSSIGYDFLSFKRPMILLTRSELTKAGRYVPPKEYSRLFAICKEELEKPPPSNTLYEETFDVKRLDISAFSSLNFAL
ncbi:MAG: hypothetical protein KR126chlam3_01117 [Chlamydiae bacterium]|nr:hypothetical protein [Chlamydiota bacterium]